ncbi:MAG: hypothetical protein WC446_08165, partial [Candidatus Paceibacterota bacterium]
EKYLAEVEISFKQKGLKVSSIVVFGQPADQIIDYSQANNVDLLLPPVMVEAASHAGYSEVSLIKFYTRETRLFWL